MLHIGIDTREGKRALVLWGVRPQDEFELGKAFGFLLDSEWLGAVYHKRDADGVSRLTIDFARDPSKEGGGRSPA